MEDEIIIEKLKKIQTEAMDFEHEHDAYYVGKNLDEAIESWKGEKELWG
jgi:hypothetical protein